MISNVSRNESANTKVQPYVVNNSGASQATKVQEDDNVVISKSVDTVDIDTSTQSSSIYTKSGGKKIDSATIEGLKQQADRANEHLRSIVQKLILKQGKSSDPSSIDPSDVEDAKQAISDDGEYGVKAVSDRIVDFAIAISGNDKTKLDELKAAIEKGFDEVGKAFGGKLPDISSQTHDEIMKKLDKWAQEN